MIRQKLQLLSANQDEKCFACGKIFRPGKQQKLVNVALEDQDVFVGPECYKYVKAAGNKGWQPMQKGKAFGPRLYLMEFKRRGK